MPPFDAGVLTVRVRLWVPPPHVFEHIPNSLQSFHWQSTGTGHACSLQAWVSLIGPWHSIPPFDAGVFTVRVRLCVPPPQVFEHVPNALQSFHSQSTGTGHACSLHAWLSLVGPSHSMPPPEAGVFTVRVRVWVPPPHVFEHVPNALQSFQTQSTGMGHACSLQAWLSLVGPSHALPPLDAGVFTVRVRVCVPPPHIFEHVPNAVQSFQTQSTGGVHAASLQALVSLSAGQAAPPLAGCVMMVRVRDWVPPPHSTEHPCHSPKALTLQSMT